MRKLKFLLFSLIILIGIGCAPKEEAVISIGPIKITKSEFDKDFLKFNLGKPDSPAARKEFLENLINRKLILKEAEIKGLDRDERFLESVQDFWEQALLKLAVDRKSKELFLNMKVDDSSIEDYYKAHSQEFSGKTLAEAYPQIRLIVFKEKQRQAVADWMDSLKKAIPIKVNYKVLGIEEEK